MLTEEVTQAQRSVRTDAYQMSIGEIVSMYDSEEIIVDPEFQRLFRWNISQKSKLIESLLLGIPLPSIFVFEKDDGKWELIDGLQRLSTILEFMGKLKSPEGPLLPPSILEATKYLPSLHNTAWEKSALIADVVEDQQRPLEKSQQLAIRRARIGVEILKRPSDDQTKFDLFQRLNAGGTPANAQELRNCIMLMVNAPYFRAIKEAAERDNFKNVIAVTDDQIERQRHLEFAIRFLVHTFVPYDGTLDVEEYIDEGAVQLASAANIEQDIHTINHTFDLLFNAAQGNALRRFEKNQHTGKVGLEGIAVGVGKNITAILAHQNPTQFVQQKLQSFWAQPAADGFTSPGLRGTTRIQRTVPFGEQWFTP